METLLWSQSFSLNTCANLGSMVSSVRFLAPSCRISITMPLGKGRELNVHNTFRRHPNVLRTFNLGPMSRGIPSSTKLNDCFFLTLSCRARNKDFTLTGHVVYLVPVLLSELIAIQFC